MGEDRDLRRAAGRDREPVRRQSQSEGRQERGSARVPQREVGDLWIKLEKPAADSQYVELCNSGGDSALQYFNPFIEWNPHAPSVVWAMHKFFPENYMGPIGLSVEEENLRAGEATRGETFDITLTKGPSDGRRSSRKSSSVLSKLER